MCVCTYTKITTIYDKRQNENRIFTEVPVIGCATKHFRGIGPILLITQLNIDKHLSLVNLLRFGKMEGLAGYSSDDSDPAPIIRNPIKNEPIKASGGINLSIIPQHIRDALDRSLGDADGADGDSDSDWEHEMQRKSSASRTANGNASTGAAGSAKSLLTRLPEPKFTGSGGSSSSSAADTSTKEAPAVTASKWSLPAAKKTATKEKAKPRTNDSGEKEGEDSRQELNNIIAQDRKLSTDIAPQSSGKANSRDRSFAPIVMTSAAAPIASTTNTNNTVYDEAPLAEEQPIIQKTGNKRKRSAREIEQELKKGNMSVLDDVEARDVTQSMEWDSAAYNLKKEETAAIRREFMAQGMATQGMPSVSASQKKKNQLSALAAQAAETQIASMEQKAAHKNMRAETRGKYGW